MTPPRSPVSTHRLQLEPHFTFDDAAAQVGYLASLGVTHLYLSPILQAAPDSTHGYDVVDHQDVSAGLGGIGAFERLAAAARTAGLGIVVDIVPNHMTTPTPLSLNRPLWDVLRSGRSSTFAAWFDVDWDAQGGRILMPVLGDDLHAVVARGEITVDLAGDGDGPVVRYFHHVFPLAEGMAKDKMPAGMPLGELLDRQHYRLASWRLGGTELNYRRFFDVTSLIAVRVEDPTVFQATHSELLRLVEAGQVHGLRIDHPDGLADPAGYLRMLSEATGGVWVVAEKILEGDEQLPADWACAGTTGYDALLRVGGLFVDVEGTAALDDLSAELLDERQDIESMIRDAKRTVLVNSQSAEVNRLMRLVERALPEIDLAEARHVLEGLIVAMDRYRIYVTPGLTSAPNPADEATARLLLREVADRALEAQPGLDQAVVDALVALALAQGPGVDPGAEQEFCTRFQQTCGPVMAKAIEDTAYYRYVRLTGLNEVGGDPGSPGTSVADFHQFAAGLARAWPGTMTTLSTHDTKRSEDVRARLAVLAERTDAWRRWVREAWRLADPHRDDLLDPLVEYLLWQTLVGAWPIDADRLGSYAQKAVREAKLRTTWSDPDTAYEAAVERFVAGVTSDPAVARHVEAWHAQTLPETRANILGQKLVQLTMPGVPDVYQGTDLVDLSLVDPDNRRPVDYAERRARLDRLDLGGTPADLHDEKLLVTTTALRARRERPEVFVGGRAAYLPLESTSEHVVAFARGRDEQPEVVALATRLAGRLADSGGWGSTTVELPEGWWRDLLSDRTSTGGVVRLNDVLPPGGMPVAMLVRVEEAG